MLPAPVLIEFARVTTDRGKTRNTVADTMLRFMLRSQLTVEALTPDDAQVAVDANFDLGSGNGRGGTLNFGDLMVYAVARRLGAPILCTGRDFAATGAALDPTSRDW